MKIRIDSHTLERAMERGTNEDEIIDVLHAGFDIPAKKGGIKLKHVFSNQAETYQ